MNVNIRHGDEDLIFEKTLITLHRSEKILSLTELNLTNMRRAYSSESLKEFIFDDSIINFSTFFDERKQSWKSSYW